MFFKESYKKITSLQNPLVKHLVKVRENSRYRDEVNSILITSSKILNELIKITIPKRVFFTEGFSLPKLECEILKVSDAVIKKITNLPSPEGVCAEFPKPQSSHLNGAKKILALDKIADPGNLGTLIRTATALGWEGIFFLPNCVDPFHERAIRSSRGALFKMAHRYGSLEDLENLREKNQLTCFIADLNGKKLSEIQARQNLILLLSNEALGVSQDSLKLGEKITIPMPGNMESLNVAVAGAILMYGLSI